MSSAAAPPGSKRTESAPPGAVGGAVRARRPGLLRSALARPLTSYHLILAITGLLLAIGLLMVLSTTPAIALYSGGSPYWAFIKQLLGVLVGLPLMWLLARTPARFYRAVAYPMLLASIAGLILVLAIGKTAGGADRWISVGGFTVQPSEFAKLAFVLWGADLLARKEKLGQLRDWRMVLFPLLPAAALVGLLVMLGDDLGTTFVLLVIVLALLWVVGLPARLFAGILGLLGFVLLILIVVARYRLERILGFLNSQSRANWQQINGMNAIGGGGLFGVGLGDSTLKWGWVPNDSTDFIFAILGEELGLVGTSCVVLLYGGLAFAGLRVARRVTDPFMRLAAAGATAWIVTEAIVNICAVIGLLPITGIPLPLISAGLSSLLVTMAALGMLMAFARSEPGASKVLAAAGPSMSARALARLGLGRPRRARPAAAAADAARSDRRRQQQGPGRARPGSPGPSRQGARLAGPGQQAGRRGGPQRPPVRWGEKGERG